MDASSPALLLIDPDPLLFAAAQATLGERYVLARSDRASAAHAASGASAAVLSVAADDTTALGLLKHLRQRHPRLSLLAHLPYPDRRLAARVRRAGADRVIEGELDLPRLRQALAEEPAATLGLIGNSPLLQTLRQRILRFAATPFPLLILGEPGSGKERVAQAVHQSSPRAALPFLALNCAALPATLAEATLFGHARGAFTGADGAQAGFFESVGNGTLFLDEIGELPLELQAKLLRVLEGGDYVRLGETRPRRFDGRLIAATNRDLYAMSERGSFRPDLLDRLAVLTLHTPPLRQLGPDRLALLDHLLEASQREHGLTPFRLDPEARAVWLAYAFPGNVRELRNITRRLLASHAGETINARQLRAELVIDTAIATSPGGGGGGGGGQQPNPADLLSGAQPFDLDHWLATQERALIEQALRLAHGRVGEAARRLGLKRATLYSRMERLFGPAA
ncbi:sigma 54-interacting transcriptional regulator [Chitinimonas lacunae]|uniref:Sigma 54-interacting transcriptional regulator n=1 Tax=Chitinimonas lacunae TaxID=1963018 RepID=A0ABV8MPM1_9NEIS